MSDDENEHQHFIFPFSFGPTPEQMEQMKMSSDANAHESRQFFDSLDEQQLRKLSGLFATCYQSDGDSAQFFMGVIAGFLDQKFKTCLACGKNHDAELHKFAPDPQTIAEQMKTYNLISAGDGSYHCARCGKDYVSLEDRMLRAPGIEGCDGCIEKERWG